MQYQQCYLASTCLTNIDEYSDGSDDLPDNEKSFSLPAIRNLRCSPICPFSHTTGMGRKIPIYRNFIHLLIPDIHNGVFTHLEKRVHSMVLANWSASWNWNDHQISSPILRRNPDIDCIDARSDNSQKNTGGNSSTNRTAGNNRTVSNN